MITTHPFLFNAIVVLFIAFTSGWMVYAMIGNKALHLKNKMKRLEKEKEHLRKHAQQLEEQLQHPYSINSTPVISLSSTVKMGITKDGSI